jgi:hypothetical protein
LLSSGAVNSRRNLKSVMPYPLFVLCRSSDPITTDVLLASIKKEPALQSAAVTHRPSTTETGWSQIAIRYSPQVKPIVLSCYLGSECQQAVEGILEDLPAPTSPEQIQLRSQLGEVIQVIRIDIDPARVPEEIWEAIDCIEAYLAFRFDGFIFAPDEGVYDEGMALLYPV